MKQLLLLYVTLLITRAPFSHAKPPLNDLVGFYEGFIANKLYELSPYRGMIAVNHGGLAKISQNYTSSRAMIRLLNLLFHQESDGSFMATSHEPYRHFTAETIGLLCAAAYSKKIQEPDAEYSVSHALAGTFKKRPYPQRLQALVKLLKEAHHEEERNLCDYGTLYQILLGFLWQKSLKRNDLEKYTQTIATQVASLIPMNALDSSGIKNYTPHQSDTLTTLENNFEQLIIEHHHYTGHYKVHPPPLEWHRDIVYKKGKPFSDCCESSLRALINEILYDSCNCCFDLNRLTESIRSRIPLPIIEFYRTYSDAHNADLYDSPQAHLQWAAAVSELSDVIYRKSFYEIDPHASNFIRVVSFIFGIMIDKTLPIEKQMEQWCCSISEKSCFSIQSSFDYRNDSHLLIKFSISHVENSQESRPIVVHLQPDHAWLTQELEESNSSNETMQTHLKNICTEQELTLPLKDLLLTYHV